MPNAYVKFESRLPIIVAVGVQMTREAAGNAATAIEQGCKSRSRVLTGTMRNGWQTEQVESDTFRVYNPVSYTIFNELGTMYMAAQPMLIPTLEEVMPDFEAEVKASWYGAGKTVGIMPGGRI